MVEKEPGDALKAYKGAGEAPLNTVCFKSYFNIGKRLRLYI
ncbi:hypothetical protein [Dictyobacter kobayashii]|uniref:Uncharacterized protein n=1 Tax=Dictyobacter kobayashii TaxID=2014872 RepID=A0A402AHP4_9CHLR|nr:hypothetical protein [Dictyobacter kobayashii]GCE18619.1 hypothetical protein KDK_24190 [Dictyobacter kobayashii]